MSRRGTSGASLQPDGRSDRRGSALVASLVVFVGLLGLVCASIATSTAEVERSRRAFEEVRTKYLAEAGVERSLKYFSDAAEKAGATPLEGIADLFADGEPITPFLAEPLLNGGAQVGAFTVTAKLVEQTDSAVTLDIEATGYLPDAPQNLPEGQSVRSWEAVAARVKYEVAPSEVFNYAYFINNWGWFYGDTIVCNGNARSNGQFDVAGYSPTITGQPLYDDVEESGGTVSLSGYQDDNGDGLQDGNDGGIFSGWDIVGASGVKQNGGLASNQYDFEETIDMPNLSDLSSYEALALNAGGKITVGGVTMTNAVYGDEAGELERLYLVGTKADPIVLDGPVVVKDDVIIYGYVTGQGSIFSGGNIYVPNSITYLDPPATNRPSGNTQAETEKWLENNWDKDFLGLFSAENIVVGDHTDPKWSSYVKGWMTSSMNQSEEDAGEDGIPSTSAGKDGILGTADDDVLEQDGTWTTELYSEADKLLGLIPDGFDVGDPIPGTGEDIDGDGEYDDTTALTDLDLKKGLNAEHWGGNMPATGIGKYKHIATLYATNLDAVFYTNHSFCYVVLGSKTARINGSLVSRNENIVYGTPTLEFNYDCRLLAGAEGFFGKLLPRTLKDPEVERWQSLDEDPNRYVGTASEVAP